MHRVVLFMSNALKKLMIRVKGFVFRLVCRVGVTK